MPERSTFSKVSFSGIVHCTFSILRISTISASIIRGNMPDRYSHTRIRTHKHTQAHTLAYTHTRISQESAPSSLYTVNWTASSLLRNSQISSTFILWQHARQVEFLKSQRTTSLITMTVELTFPYFCTSIRYSHPKSNFWKGSSLVMLYSQFSSALTFYKFDKDPVLSSRSEYLRNQFLRHVVW